MAEIVGTYGLPLTNGYYEWISYFNTLVSGGHVGWKPRNGNPAVFMVSRGGSRVPVSDASKSDIEKILDQITASQPMRGAYPLDRDSMEELITQMLADFREYSSTHRAKPKIASR